PALKRGPRRIADERGEDEENHRGLHPPRVGTPGLAEEALDQGRLRVCRSRNHVPGGVQTAVRGCTSPGARLTQGYSSLQAGVSKPDVLPEGASALILAPPPNGG